MFSRLLSGVGKLPVLGLAVLLSASAPGLSAHAAGKPLNIVTTVGMIGDAIQRIAGEHATVEALIGSGVDPHGYRQTRSDVVKLGRADVIFYNGLYLEAQLEDLLLKLATRKPVIALGERLPRKELLAHLEYSERFDPHIWMDVDLWSRVVAEARDAMIEIDPANRADYEANAKAYRAEMAELSDYIRAISATVPEEERIVVTAHDAFSYFGRAYGFKVVGIQGISTQSEAGLRRIETIVDLIVARNVKAVFVESSVSERNVRALVEGAQARGHTVVVGGQLFSDAMGQPGSYEGTYLGMLDHNATLIVRSLGGTAPLAGRLGRLGAGS
ncbi:zinc ABC transporter substrate-binding protein [Breoghania sp. L-A4]|uniref:metal ABC transporter solute-binding protein, Zn/Mn family n=1 Tax=Breoghania sp. L-A4 TaxID=2304600 RepID=UPI0020BF2B4E|nr:zinc ABC transporter substrate-binding protein [Breoghania sp. L-A4]